MANYNVVKNPNRGWDVKKDNAKKASFHADTQKQAEIRTKQFSANSGGGEVRIQGMDGRYRDNDTIPPAIIQILSRIKSNKATKTIIMKGGGEKNGNSNHNGTPI